VNNSILFGTLPLKAQNDKMWCKLEACPLGPSMATPIVLTWNILW